MVSKCTYILKNSKERNLNKCNIKGKNCLVNLHPEENLSIIRTIQQDTEDLSSLLTWRVYFTIILHNND